MENLSKKENNIIISMRLEIILRIHDGENIHGRKPRYIRVSKKDLIIGCFTSLVNSTNFTNDIEIKFTILNDHCSYDCIKKIKEIISHSKHLHQLIDLQISGFNHSALKQFEYCKNSDADVVYSVEDDYLHCDSSITEMIDAYNSLKKQFDLKEICIFPFDTPQEYDFYPKGKYYVTRGKSRYWKSSDWTTQTFMTSPSVFKKHWYHFEKLAKEFKVIPRNLKDKIDEKDIVWEDTTIGNIWRSDVSVFHPIPSLALHIQFEKEKDPFIDHQMWWNNFTQIKKISKISYN